MTKHDHRRHWLRVLKKEVGTYGALAEKIGTDAAYISSIVGKKAKRNMGDDVARRAERIFGLPNGAMDYPSAAAQSLIDESEGMSDAAIAETVAFMKFKKTNKH